MAVNVPPPLIIKGDHVKLDIRTRDGDIDGDPYINVDEVRMTLTDPLGVIRINNQAASLISGRTGLYRITYQTLTSHPSGDWIEDVTTVRGGSVNRKKGIAFVLHN